MSKIIFNEYQQWTLEANQNIDSVSDRAIRYTPEFKIHAVKENLVGKGPSQIFAQRSAQSEWLLSLSEEDRTERQKTRTESSLFLLFSLNPTEIRCTILFYSLFSSN